MEHANGYRIINVKSCLKECILIEVYFKNKTDGTFSDNSNGQ